MNDIVLNGFQGREYSLWFVSKVEGEKNEVENLWIPSLTVRRFLT